MRTYQLKEIAAFGALMFFVMTSFPDHVIVIGVLFLVGFMALEDLSQTAFLQAMQDDTIKQTTAEPGDLRYRPVMQVQVACVAASALHAARSRHSDQRLGKTRIDTIVKIATVVPAAPAQGNKGKEVPRRSASESMNDQPNPAYWPRPEIAAAASQVAASEHDDHHSRWATMILEAVLTNARIGLGGSDAGNYRFASAGPVGDENDVGFRENEGQAHTAERARADARCIDNNAEHTRPTCVRSSSRASSLA